MNAEMKFMTRYNDQGGGKVKYDRKIRRGGLARWNGGIVVSASRV